MTFNQPNMIMLKNLIGFCEDNNCIIKNITNHAGDKEYDILLTWVEPRHDGSKCKKLPIEESKPLHNLTCVTDPAITRMELDGAKSEIPDADNEVTVKAKEIEVGMELYYYGNDKTKHGKKCRVMSVSNNGYSNTIQFEDNCTYNQISCTQLRRKADGA